jgi:hypothetical protein
MPKTDHTQATLSSQAAAELFPGSAPSTNASPLELTQQQQQTLLHAALATITHFFGPPQRFLAGIEDPRDQSRITYPLPALLWVGVWMFLCHLGARRQVTHRLRENAPSAANFARLFGVAGVPHGDTLNHTYARLEPAQVQARVTDLSAHLIRQKVFLRYRLLDHYYVILIDGTGIYTFHQRHCAHCLTREMSDGHILYYHNVLEAKLVTYDGLVCSLMSEFIENPAPHPTKQDCELKAFYRLAARLKERFPRLPICLSMDGLFACGPVFQLCHDYHWHYVIVLKDDDLPSVTQEFAALAPLNPQQRLRLSTGPHAEIKQRLRWVNQIDYTDTQGRAHLLNVLELSETKPQADGPPESKRFVWVTDFNLKETNARELAQNAGRIRWKIENEGFNAQKHGGFALEHAYSQNDQAAKVFYYLLQIAHLLFQLIVAGSLLKHYFPQGFGSLKNFAWRLLEAWRNCLLHPQALSLIQQLRCQIRLDSS